VVGCISLPIRLFCAQFSRFVLSRFNIAKNKSQVKKHK